MQTLLCTILAVAVISAAVLFGRKDKQQSEAAHKKSLAILDDQWAFIHLAEDFACAVLESHPELIHYDEELRELAGQVAEARERLHRVVHNNKADDYQSPLRELLP